jgi:uncharacterized membrane protein
MRQALLLLLGLLGIGCGTPHALRCEDLLPSEEARFEFVQGLVRDCARCHSTATPVRGINFEGPGVAFEALTRRRDSVYEQVASGEMPQGGPAWGAAELKLLRSWYCAGAPYAR